MASLVDKIITIASKEIGTKEVPAGSNKVKYNTKFYGKAVSGAAYPWCMVFVWWVFMKAALSKYLYGGSKIASTQELERWAKSKKKTVGVKEGRAGDLILFDFAPKSGHAEHVGIIKEKTTTGYKTIEGNTSTGNNSNGGEVMLRDRKFSDVRCIVRVLPTSAKAPNPIIAAASGSLKAVKQAAIIYVVSSASTAILRKEPNKDAKEIIRFTEGTEVTLVEKTNDLWYKVKGKNPSGRNITGYVSRRSIKMKAE